MSNALSVSQFKDCINNGAEIIDTREVTAFKESFIPGSIHIPYNAKFQDWVKALISTQEPLLLVTEEANAAAITKDLEAWHYSVAGFLAGGFTSWKNADEPVDMIIEVAADELMMDIPFDERLLVVDVRNPIEFAEGHLKQAANIPLHQMADPLKIAQLEDTDNLYIHCGGGSRSIMACSLLKKQGLHNLRNVAGGWSAIKEEAKADIVKEPEVLN